MTVTRARMRHGLVTPSPLLSGSEFHCDCKLGVNGEDFLWMANWGVEGGEAQLNGRAKTVVRVHFDSEVVASSSRPPDQVTYVNGKLIQGTTLRAPNGGTGNRPAKRRPAIAVRQTWSTMLDPQS